MQDPLFIVVDLFCGFGGTTKGFVDAELPTSLISELAMKAMGSNRLGGSQDSTSGTFKIAKVIACVNHDPKAIKSHYLNHPDVAHFEEDIRTLNLEKLIAVIEYWRAIYPNALLVLWASLECTNFSKAKGGQARDADSRTLADDFKRYVKALKPDYIQIENVVEFMSWGPLDEKGKPISRKNGIDWMRWCKEIDNMGYRNEWRELNSANYGAYTSRNRLFGIFAKPHLPIDWPAPTHTKKTKKNIFNRQLYKDMNLEPWKAVKEVLDFEDRGESIFLDLIEKKEKDCKKYLAKKGKKKDKIEKRIVLMPAEIENPIYGCEPKCVILQSQLNDFDRIVADYLLNFNLKKEQVKFYRYDPYAEATLERVLAGLIKFVGLGDKSFLSNYKSGHPASKNTSVEDPCNVLTTIPTQSVVQTEFLIKYNSMGKDGGYNPPSIENPSPAIPCRNMMGIVQTEFLASYYGNGHNLSSIDNACPTIPTKDRIGLYFIDREFSSGGRNSSIDSPVGSILATPKLNLVEAAPFILHTAYKNGPTSVKEPFKTLTASRHHPYIINPAYGGNIGSVEEPCFVVVARQDKAPLSIAEAVSNEDIAFSIAIFESDSEAMVKIKYFMAQYGIVDIRMRMLKVIELLKIQGFPEDYKMFGNQTDHKKHIGNSVVPKVPKSMIMTLGTSVIEYLKKAA